MGVKDLWSVLSPISRKGTLCELEGKTVAIDLSGWVCENQQVGEKCASSQPRMYLRNLFFRTYMLLMLNVKPIFVLDGEAPLLKTDAIVLRNRNRGRDCKGSASRRRLKGLVNQCSYLLDTLGVSCVQGTGEAEATCAWLDMQGLVDGVITQDSDAFLYGAKTVYRNFTIHGSTGSIEVYKMVDIEDKLGLSRDKLVALSLLCGCDYNMQGVIGIGKETAYRFLVTLETSALDHLRAWRCNEALDKYEEQRNNCSKCSHRGKARLHIRTGCRDCGTDRGCCEDKEPSSYRNLGEEQLKRINLEVGLRRKALVSDKFPEEELIHEYLGSQEEKTMTLRIQSEWNCPNVTKFVSYAGKMLTWEPEYSVEKILPLSVRWSLLNPTHGQYNLLAIVKKRTHQGAPSFQINWTVTDENIAQVTQQVTTVEPQLLVSKIYPSQVESFWDAKKTKPKKRQTKKSKNTISKIWDTKPVDDVVQSMSMLSLLEDEEQLPHKQTSWQSSPLAKKGVLERDQTNQSDLHSINKFQTIEKHEFVKKDTKYQSELLDLSTASWSQSESFDISIFTATLSQSESFDVCTAASNQSESFDICTPATNQSESFDICTPSLDQSDVEDKNKSDMRLTNGTLDDTITLDDSTTQDYDINNSLDISLIVDQIISRKRFY